MPWELIHILEKEFPPYGEDGVKRVHVDSDTNSIYLNLLAEEFAHITHSAATHEDAKLVACAVFDGSVYFETVVLSGNLIISFNVNGKYVGKRPDYERMYDNHHIEIIDVGVQWPILSLHISPMQDRTLSGMQREKYLRFVKDFYEASKANALAQLKSGNGNKS